MSGKRESDSGLKDNERSNQSRTSRTQELYLKFSSRVSCRNVYCLYDNYDIQTDHVVFDSLPKNSLVIGEFQILNPTELQVTLRPVINTKINESICWKCAESKRCGYCLHGIPIAGIEWCPDFDTSMTVKELNRDRVASLLQRYGLKYRSIADGEVVFRHKNVDARVLEVLKVLGYTARYV